MAKTYEPIGTPVTLGSAVPTVTFSSIPSTYTDLVLIASVLGSGGTNDYGYSMRFNSDTATNYSGTHLWGNGTASFSTRQTSGTYAYIQQQQYYSTTIPMIAITSIMNYANATTYKTLISRNDYPSVDTEAGVYLWRKTPEAITSITVLLASSTNFAIGSTFSLYGIKAA
jgi:hypothetical protein